jgi:hypothetical protein
MNRNVITWPERGKINMMHSDSRVKEPVCLATTSLPDPCLSTYLSPRFREEPFFIPANSKPFVNPKTFAAIPGSPLEKSRLHSRARKCHNR